MTDSSEKQDAGPEDDWPALLNGRADPVDCLWLRAPLGQGEGGTSGSFWGLGSDGARWRVKPMTSPHGAMATINEFLVGRLGELITAPVVRVELIEVRSDILPWEFLPGHPLTAGITVASREVEGVYERKVLDHRDRDDNRRRHVGVLALYDWCLGGDPQWLYESGAEDRVHSHDHGMYLGTDWRNVDLMARLAEHIDAGGSGELDRDVATSVANLLDAVTEASVATVLREFPVSWDVLDDHLSSIGRFLVARAPLVAERLRAL